MHLALYILISPKLPGLRQILIGEDSMVGVMSVAIAFVHLARDSLRLLSLLNTR